MAYDLRNLAHSIKGQVTTMLLLAHTNQKFKIIAPSQKPRDIHLNTPLTSIIGGDLCGQDNTPFEIKGIPKIQTECTVSISHGRYSHHSGQCKCKPFAIKINTKSPSSVC